LVSLTCLLAGPIFGVLYFLADAHFVSSDEFLFPDDYWRDMIALAILGLGTGLAASLVAWVGIPGEKHNHNG
jgi:hypothetical protein